MIEKPKLEKFLLDTGAKGRLSCSHGRVIVFIRWMHLSLGIAISKRRMFGGFIVVYRDSQL